MQRRPIPDLPKDPHANKRTDVRLNHRASVLFGIRGYERGYLKDKKNYLPLIELLMKYFVEGFFDKTYRGHSELKKPDLESKRKRIMVNTKLKDKFENRAFRLGLIPDITFSSWLVYDLMIEYNKGTFDAHFPKLSVYD